MVEQTLLVQSPESLHACPASHAAHGPPQSTSDSFSLATSSVQWIGTQVSRSHSLPRQSVFTLQCNPSLQRAQLPPPQSTSLSPPLRVESSQVGA
jgi:hypothetical protein